MIMCIPEHEIPNLSPSLICVDDLYHTHAAKTCEKKCNFALNSLSNWLFYIQDQYIPLWTQTSSASGCLRCGKSVVRGSPNSTEFSAVYLQINMTSKFLKDSKT